MDVERMEEELVGKNMIRRHKIKVLSSPWLILKETSSEFEMKEETENIFRKFCSLLDLCIEELCPKTTTPTLYSNNI